jgi:hypothetical protein
MMRRARIGAIIGSDDASYDLSIDEDVLLGNPKDDVSRVILLLERVAEHSDALEGNHAPPFDKAVDLLKGMRVDSTRPDWRLLCHGAEGISTKRNGVEMFTADERRHRIGIVETPHTYELTGVVARVTAMDPWIDLPIRVWRRNRAMQLVGFRTDQKGRVVGNAWVPKAGLGRDEFLNYLRRLVAECGLFRYYLTGRIQPKDLMESCAPQNSSGWDGRNFS